MAIEITVLRVTKQYPYKYYIKRHVATSAYTPDFLTWHNIMSQCSGAHCICND